LNSPAILSQKWRDRYAQWLPEHLARKSVGEGAQWTGQRRCSGLHKGHPVYEYLVIFKKKRFIPK